MPTNQDETLQQRYARDHQDYLKLCGSMTAEQVADLQLQLNNALAGEVVLTKENNLLRHDIASYLETAAKVCELLGVDVYAARNTEGKPSDVLFSHAQALNSRLSIAEQQNAGLVELLLQSKDVLIGIWDKKYDHEEGDALAALALIDDIDAALKPTESGASE